MNKLILLFSALAFLTGCTVPFSNNEHYGLEAPQERVEAEEEHDELVDSKKDSDGDGLSDILELEIGTNPNNQDTDNDGYGDWQEVTAGYDPLVAYTPIVVDCGSVEPPAFLAEGEINANDDTINAWECFVDNINVCNPAKIKSTLGDNSAEYEIVSDGWQTTLSGDTCVIRGPMINFQGGEMEIIDCELSNTVVQYSFDESDIKYPGLTFMKGYNLMGYITAGCPEVPIATSPQAAIDYLAKALSDKDAILYLSILGEAFSGKNSMTLQEVEDGMEEVSYGDEIILEIIPELSEFQFEVYYRARVQVFVDGEDVTINDAGKNEIILQEEGGLWKVIDIELANFR